MTNPTIQEQLDTVSTLLPKEKELRKPLELQKRILQIQLRIDKTSKQGSTLSWNDHETITNLQKKSNETKQPIANFLDLAIFDPAALSQEAKKIAEAYTEFSGAVIYSGDRRLPFEASLVKENGIWRITGFYIGY